MNGEEVLKLIDAGFTADEIRKMSETKEEPSKDTDEPAPKGEESGEENTTTVTPDINTDFMDSIKKSVEDISKQVKALQESNIKKAEEKKSEHLSAADVVTSFMENL